MQYVIDRNKLILSFMKNFPSQSHSLCLLVMSDKWPLENLCLNYRNPTVFLQTSLSTLLTQEYWISCAVFCLHNAFQMTARIFNPALFTPVRVPYHNDIFLLTPEVTLNKNSIFCPELTTAGHQVKETWRVDTTCGHLTSADPFKASINTFTLLISNMIN